MVLAKVGSFITAPAVILQLLTISMVQIERQVRYNRLLEEKQRLSEYDYIVVGAGASGAPIANRLTEDDHIQVLLLEAGGQQTVLSDIPGMAQAMIDNPEFDWRYPTIPQKFFTEVSMDANNGKRLGGSSAINGMIYNRGNARDYDNWVEKYGAEGWSFKEVLPYFMRAENNTDPKLVAENPGFHGTAGPVRVSTDPSPAPLLGPHQKALNEWGIVSTDINGANQLGTTIVQTTAHMGRRYSTANAYIDPNPHSDNLNILVYSFVTKILFEKTSKGITATGVEYIKDGHVYTAMAKKEVILCAGVVRSPQLLMVSGIGPRHHLEEFGIPVIADLPVGDWVQDHPAVSIHMYVKSPNLRSPGPALSIGQLYQLFTTGTGPLAFDSDSVTYMNTKNNTDKDWPNVYFYTIVQAVSDLNVQVSEMPGDQQRLKEWQNYFRPYVGKYLTMSAPQVFRVRSWGSIRLQSKDPTIYPLVDPGFLRHPQDRADMIEIIKFVYYFLLHSSFSKYIEQLPDPIPGCQYCKDRLPYDCDEYIDCLIRMTGKSGWHLVGGNRMGNPHRPDTVVDPRGRVKFVDSLRVCDSSIIPQVMNSNSYAGSIMIGEKCSDMIKQDNGGHVSEYNYLKK